MKAADNPVIGKAILEFAETDYSKSYEQILMKFLEGCGTVVYVGMYCTVWSLLLVIHVAVS